MNTLLLFITICFVQTLAYTPVPVPRRSMIQNTLSSAFVTSALILAAEEAQEKTSKNEDDYDALNEFRFWRKRGHQWIRRRIERENLAKSRDATENDKLAEAITLYEQGRQCC